MAAAVVSANVVDVQFRRPGSMPDCEPSRAEKLRRAWDGRRKYVVTPAIDAAIRAAYQRRYETRDRKAIIRAAAELKWPRWRLVRRAAELGLARIKELDWCEEELEVLGHWAHLTPQSISRKLRGEGFDRTPTAVNMKLKRLGIQRHDGWYSACRAAAAFGVDEHLVADWIRRGCLSAEMRGTSRRNEQGGDAYLIRQEAVRDFVFAHLEEYDLARVEKWWFLELVTGGRIKR